VRGDDEVCRWAGDEFVILLPDTTAEQAERALERIRRSVATHDWSDLDLELPVTISVGVASAARGDDRRTLFAAADGVLYDAKRSGRDRVVRLSAVTQTRAASPLDHLFGPPPAAVADGADTTAADSPEDTAASASVEDVQSSPLVSAPAPASDDDPLEAGPGGSSGFAALLLEPQPTLDPPLSLGTPGHPPLGPVPSVAEPAAVASGPAAVVEPEVIWGTGRSTEQILTLVREARREFPDRPALVLRASAETLVAVAAEHDAYTTMDAAALAAAVGPLPEPAGRVRVLSAGGADAAVAAEAAFVAKVSGTEVIRVDDLRPTRLRAMLADGSLLAGADCLIVVAGADASLAGTIATLTDLPVVAVPTSAGQSSALGGLGALLTMLNSTVPGVTVSSVDNGYAAAVFAARIARRTAR
jgi:NCAIR mutase (PurE)-related protein